MKSPGSNTKRQVSAPGLMATVSSFKSSIADRSEHLRLTLAGKEAPGRFHLQMSNLPMGPAEMAMTRFRSQRSPERKGCPLNSSKSDFCGSTRTCMPNDDEHHDHDHNLLLLLFLGDCRRVSGAAGRQLRPCVVAPQGRLAIFDALGSKDGDAAPGIRPTAVTH